ncbi:MAG: hypothetical protein ABI806_01275 [Candidatus Solibacter sp.]
MTKLLFLLLAAPLAYGAVSNLQVRGVNSTQGVIAYSAPDVSACTVEISESQTYRPLAHDVDPALFAGSNLDSRPESTSTGIQRLFVAGKRRAEKGVDGHWYSRALQAFTTHFFRITCGSSQATGSFLTSNIALGNTYNEALPADPDVSSRPYFTPTGSYAWPEFKNWNNQDPTARPEAVIDPQTGMLLKRLALPQDQPIAYLPGSGDHFFTATVDKDGVWNLPLVTWSLANGKLVSFIVGSSGSATITTSSAHLLKTGSQVTVSGLTGSAAAGNANYQITSVPNGTSFVVAQGSLPASTTLTDATLSVSAAALTADDGTSASFSGSGSNALFVGDQTFWINTSTSLSDITIPIEYITLSVKGWCSGACAGEDAKIQACISINGITCWPTNATAKYQEATLNTSPSNIYTVLGSAVPLLDSWTPVGFNALHRGDISRRSGLVDVDAAGVATWQPGGATTNTYFNANWVAGSRIVIANSECKIASVAGLTQLTIDPASCSTPLTLPLSKAAYWGSNFGFLIRKKTGGTDQINLQYAKYSTGTSQYIDFTASGSARLCSTSLTRNTVTGGLGYHCVIPSGWPLLYWVDHKSGDSTYLGLFSRTGVAGPDGFVGGVCDGGATLRGSSPDQPEKYYCSGTDNETPGKSILVKCSLTTTNQPGNATVACSNITPGTTGRDLSSLAAEFTAADTPAFDKAKYKCNIVGQQGAKLVLGCGRSIQDTLGWTVMFDPDKVGTGPGCVGGGAAGCVVAAASTWATAPARWCVAHTRFVSGNTDVLWIAGKYFTPNTPPVLDDGPYVSNITSGPLTATVAIAAGTGACPAGSKGCTVVTVDGEPCDPSPAANEATGANVCPKNSAWAYLQDAKVGDAFLVDNEYLLLVAKNGNDWTLQRGYGYSVPAAHASTALPTHCLSRDFDHGISNWSWTWDTARDPHGLNSDGTTVLIAWDYDHPVPRPDVTIGGKPSYDGNCPNGSCYAIREGSSPIGDPPNRYASMSPPFSGATGTAQFGERAQDHPSWLQDNAARWERQWFLDGRPLQPLMDISDAAISVSGQLYRLTSTTTDGDNLRRVGFNIYVVKSSPTTLVIAGNCSAANPCPIWNDTTLLDSITQPCTVTVLGGSGTVFITRLSAGGLGVTYTSGLSISADSCPTALGTTYPGGSTWLWSWGASLGSWATAGSDQRGGSSGLFGTMNRKLQPTWAYCGMQALVDASGATIGDVLSDTTADSYKYCIARKSGECRSASAPGDIYVNCPNLVKRNGGSYGCMWYMQNSETPVDVCIGNMSSYLNSIAQVGFKKNDFTGALGRTLTKGLAKYKIVDGYWHGKALADASWSMFRTMLANGVWTDILLGKMPPYPPVDSVVRATFQPLPVKLSPPSGLGIDNAVIQFGYAENGPPDKYNCTSRQEACLATASTVPAVPFLFPSEGAGGTMAGIAGLSCASSCTIAIPAISQRVLYYQVLYRNAANNIVAKGRTELIVTP